MWIAVAIATVGALVTTSGILVMRNAAGWARRNKAYFISFAAGVLIAVSLLHLVPESLALTRLAPGGLLLGYGLMHLMARFVTSHVCRKPEDAAHALGLVAMLGIGFHSLLDGVIYSIAFNVSHFTGMLVAVGMVLHEFPEGIVTYSLLLCGGFSEKRSFALALIAAAVTTPLGTLISYPWIERLGGPMLGGLLAVSAGALLYVGATHLLPQAEQERSRFGLAAFAAGLVAAVAMALAERIA